MPRIFPKCFENNSLPDPCFLNPCFLNPCFRNGKAVWTLSKNCTFSNPSPLPPTSRYFYFTSSAIALVLMNYTYLADAYSASLSASVLCCLPTTVVVIFDAGSALEGESVWRFRILIWGMSAEEQVGYGINMYTCHNGTLASSSLLQYCQYVYTEGEGLSDFITHCAVM